MNFWFGLLIGGAVVALGGMLWFYWTFKDMWR